jgi:hypothetical protein
MELRALLERPPIVQTHEKFPAFYGTRKFITVFTRAPPVIILSHINPIHIQFSKHLMIISVKKTRRAPLI